MKPTKTNAVATGDRVLACEFILSMVCLPRLRRGALWVNGFRDLDFQIAVAQGSGPVHSCADAASERFAFGVDTGSLLPLPRDLNTKNPHGVVHMLVG
jgi:hypothetical protein